MVRLLAPIRVRPAKRITGKLYSLNLNYYRNWHFQQSNTIKKAFLRDMKEQLEGLKLDTPIELTFILFKGSKRKIDRSNILCIVEKFLCDALVHYGCIEDDNDNYIQSTHYFTGGIDKENPRCEIEIR